MDVKPPPSSSLADEGMKVFEKNPLEYNVDKEVKGSKEYHVIVLHDKISGKTYEVKVEMTDDKIGQFTEALFKNLIGHELNSKDLKKIVASTLKSTGPSLKSFKVNQLSASFFGKITGKVAEKMGLKAPETFTILENRKIEKLKNLLEGVRFCDDMIGRIERERAEKQEKYNERAEAFGKSPKRVENDRDYKNDQRILDDHIEIRAQLQTEVDLLVQSLPEAPARIKKQT